MFETSVIHAEVVAQKRAGLLSVSFAGHVLIVISILAMGIRNIEFPTRAPAEYTLPVITLPVSIPPALGVPNGGHKQTTPPAPAKQQQVAPNANLAPNNIPDHAEPLVPSTTTPDPNATSDGPGSDQQKGVPWGVPHGIDVDGPPATTTTVEPEIPVRVMGDVKAPVVIRRVTPPYPRAALAIHKNGFVIVECIIDKSGVIRDAKVLRSSSPLFDQSAIDAVLQWQFTPGSQHGNAIDTIFDLTVTFQVTQ